ncbi:hypothetical protein L596_008239 [Steinernema carpocapsae]|uniref:Uncharacterized protein n=1 Tax=Steinernema carpocapsae TaxID=34508 RepID=A0A4U5PBY7_STECR|nr:hypothetical protein L596_008239 [Steinernema carpocapsae]
MILSYLILSGDVSSRDREDGTRGRPIYHFCSDLTHGAYRCWERKGNSANGYGLTCCLLPVSFYVFPCNLKESQSRLEA